MANSLHVLGNLSEAAQGCYATGAHKSHDTMIRKIVSEVMHHSTKSRAQIADEMSQLVHVAVTAHMLNGYAAPSKSGARFPAAFVNAFCEVTGDDRLQRLLLSPALRNKVEIVERELNAAQEKHRAQQLREQLLEEQNSLPLFTDPPTSCTVLPPTHARNIQSKGGVR